MPKPLLVLGTSTFPEEIAEIARETGFEVEGFVENLERSKTEGTKEGLPIHWIDDIAGLKGTHQVICGLGTTQRKRFIDEANALDMEFATIVHPSAQVPASTKVGTGAVIARGVIVGAHTTIGEYALLNRAALVGHHSAIGECSSVMPGANIAGHSELGRCVYVGMGALILNQVTIGDHSAVGAGAVVTESLPERVLAVGIPARISRRDFDGL